MNVVIIGTGNVATVLGIQIAGSGHRILQVLGRREEQTSTLAAALDCPYSTDWAEINPAADLYLCALSDTALSVIGEKLSLPGKLVLHTAGALSKNILLPVSTNCGVLYPLQSLRKEIRPFPPIPLLVDANISESLPFILDFARTISAQVEVADDETRLKLHLGAVIVNNFTNYLYTVTADFCREQGIDFHLLVPLIRETASRVARFPPGEVQTGPAVRGDAVTIEKHLSALNNNKIIRDLYELLTYKIEAYFRKQED